MNIMGFNPLKSHILTMMQ